MQAGAGVVWHARPGDTVTEGAAAVHAAHRRAGPVRPGPRPRSTGGYDIAPDGHGVHAVAAAHRPHQLTVEITRYLVIPALTSRYFAR